MSSSEEQEALLCPNPFSTARRSKKYTSKKSYKDYLQTRPQSGSFENAKSKSIITTSNGGGGMLSDFPNNNGSGKSDSNNNIANLNGKEIAISKSKNCGGAAKFSLIMNDIHGIKQRQQLGDDTHSLKINRMHGISHTTITNLNEGKVTKAQNTQCPESHHHHHLHHPQTTIKTSSDEVNNNNNDAVTRKYYDESMEVKQKIATKDDWYASDMEDGTEQVVKSPYSQASVTGVSNSVLECVNQILLQQSMDDFMESRIDKKPNGIVSDTMKDTSPSSSSSSSAPTRSNKRVHFSTKNSMVQITAHPLPRNLTPSDLRGSHDVLNSTYENQSNDYEPIGSSRTYVDMDQQSWCDKAKPELPPKPENLMKLQQISAKRQFVQDQIYKQKNSDYELNESENDYCSISEIQDTIKSVKIVTAEIHNDAANMDDNEYSEIKEVLTPPLPSQLPQMSSESELFADVPMLPNVYSIIPGFEPSPPTPRIATKESLNKCIGQDNYITKSPMKKKISIPFHHKRDGVLKDSSIIHKKHHQSLPKLPPPPVPNAVKHQQTIKIIDDKISEITKEFELYNLDVEYTKADVVTTQIENIEEMYQFDDEENLNGNDDNKVEYNLDFEYDRASSEGIIEIETNNNNFTTVIKINETSNEVVLSSPVKHENNPSHNNKHNINKTTSTNLIELAETPKLDLKKKLNYEKFLNETGMLSKSLPRKSKFYAGSFV